LNKKLKLQETETPKDIIKEYRIVKKQYKQICNKVYNEQIHYTSINEFLYEQSKCEENTIYNMNLIVSLNMDKTKLNNYKKYHIFHLHYEYFAKNMNLYWDSSEFYQSCIRIDNYCKEHQIISLIN
jgi:predicted patatin/cPLA2 family phospholipase